MRTIAAIAALAMLSACGFNSVYESDINRAKALCQPAGGLKYVIAYANHSVTAVCKDGVSVDFKSEGIA